MGPMGYPPFIVVDTVDRGGHIMERNIPLYSVIAIPVISKINWPFFPIY
jgi:hypothetical protein